MDAEQKAQKAMLDQMLEQAKFQADMDLEQQKLALDRQEMILDAMTKLAQMEEAQAVEGARLGVEIARSVEEGRRGEGE